MPTMAGDGWNPTHKKADDLGMVTGKHHMNGSIKTNSLEFRYKMCMSGGAIHMSIQRVTLDGNMRFFFRDHTHLALQPATQNL